MSHKFPGEHGKRYAWCRVCRRVLKWSARNQENGSWNRPFNHCGKAVEFITDEKAHELLKGRPRRSVGNLMKGRVAGRENLVKRFGR